jgi:hypothetical protein
LLTLAGLALYAATAAPSVVTIFDDSLEFQVVLPTLGIAHPSGYPLYTLLGKLFTLLLPFRDPAGRANLFSALAAAAAVGLLYLICRRVIGSRPAALIATAAFAISPVWWSQATIAEVYALHGLLVALFIYCLLRWEETSFQLPASSSHWLIAAALTFGFGLAHHRMIALLLPAALVFVLWTDPALLCQPRRWPPLLLCALAPLLLYLYLPIRGQATGSLDAAFRPTLAGALEWITAAGYSVFLAGNPFGVSRDAAFFLDLFADQFGFLLSLAAAWGAGALAARVLFRRRGLFHSVYSSIRPRQYIFLLLATAGQVAFGIAYKVEDVSVFFIPAFMLMALWAALGLAPIFEGVRACVAGLAGRLALPRGMQRGIWGVAALAVAALLLLQPVADARRNLPKQDRSREWAVYDYGQDILACSAPAGRIVGLLGETTLVRYFQDVLGQRADVTLVAADAESARWAAVEAGLAAGSPVYLTRDLPGAAGRYSLDAIGPLIAVSPKATPGPPPAGQVVAAGIVLVDAQAELRPTHAGPVVRLKLTWAATAAVQEELKVSARLLDRADPPRTVAQNDQAPVHFTYPTTAWVPGELVDDVYDLAPPKDAPPGPYSVLLILYRAADGREIGRHLLPNAITL